MIGNVAGNVTSNVTSNVTGNVTDHTLSYVNMERVGVLLAPQDVYPGERIPLFGLLSRSAKSIELNITGRLPLAGNLRPLVPSLFMHYQTKTFNLRENPMSVL